MKTLPLRVAYSLSGLLLLVLLVLGTQIRHGLEYLNEPLRGHLDAQPADFQPDGTTVIKGWAYHAAGVQAASLIVDEKRRLPLERASFTDSEIVRPEDGGLAILASSTPEAGNWLVEKMIPCYPLGKFKDFSQEVE